MTALPANLQATAGYNIPGVGSGTDAFSGLIAGAPNTTALAAQLNTAASSEQMTAVSQAGMSAIALAASGKAPSDAQVEGLAVGVATAAAVIAGATAAAAGAVIAPMAAVVFGAGTLIGAGIKKVFKIPDCTLTSTTECTGKPQRVAGQPGFVSYAQGYLNFRSTNAYLTQALGGDPSKVPTTWKPYTQGAFETAMRPVIMKILEIYQNCGALPMVKDERTAMQGVVNMWNSAAPAGTSMRNITWQADDLEVQFPGSFGQSGPKVSAQAAQDSIAYSWDPVQRLMQILFDTWNQDNCHLTFTGSQHPWMLTVADISAASVAPPPPTPVVVQKVITLKLKTASPPATQVAIALSPHPPNVYTGQPLPVVLPPSLLDRLLPFVPAVVGAGLFPFVGVLGPIVGGVASAVWYELKK